MQHRYLAVFRYQRWQLAGEWTGLLYRRGALLSIGVLII